VKRAIRKYSTDFISLIVLFLIAIGVSGFIIYNQDARPSIPLLEPKPKVLNFEFSDAQAVTPGQGQSIRVAGVQVGKIVAVRPRNGVALVKTEIQPKFWNKIDVKTDATGLLRPRTGLKDMFIELDPGQRGEVVKDGGTIPVQNTSPDVDPDEVLAAFDTDTRSYLQLLINGAGKGLKNRGDDLNATFKALGPTQRDLNRVTSAIGERKEALKELITRYGSLTNALADKDREIKTLITASDAVFRAFASQSSNISLAVARLPGTLRQTERTLTKANAYARLLRPTLNELRPPFRQLDTTNRQVLPFVREAFPIVRGQIRPFVQIARPYFRDLGRAGRNLARATPDFTASFHQLNRFFNMAAHNPRGAEPLTANPVANTQRDEGFLYWLGWVTMVTDSMFSTSDAIGPFRRAYFGVTCDTVKALIEETPASGPLIGLINAINDPVLCGNPSGNPIIPDLGLPFPNKGGKASAGQKPSVPPDAIKPENTPTPTKPEQPKPQGTPTVPTTPSVPDAPDLPDAAGGAAPSAPRVAPNEVDLFGGRR
jgi:phospholipid/cholesterol/gamma-HCH transport system substrate-binding protein